MAKSSWRYGLSKGTKQILKSVALMILGLGLIVLLSAHPGMANAPKIFPEIRGVWVTTNDTDIVRDHTKLQEAVNQLARLNFNTIYPVVWNSGYVFYPSMVAQTGGFQPFIRKGLQGQDILADLINLSHQKGILVIPWFEFGFMTSPSSELALNYPQWLTSRQDGIQTWEGAAGEVVWLNPFHPEVQQLITNLVLEVMTQYQGDGIQFDDHLSLPIEFGYDPYTVKLYQQQTNSLPPKDPKDPAWVRWRANKITEFVQKLNKTVKAKNPKAIFSIAPNPYHTAYNSHLQDWVGWVKKNLVDELIVQIYRPDLPSFVRELVKPEIQAARGKIPTGVGILTGLRNRPIGMQQIQAKIQAARQNGLGFSFFFYESLWDEAPETRQ
ncbi:MAG: glycoside hydrolase family 10 protein [Planktothrix sp. GU0601_MAG3]|nr:MAG: glycoside hydrolase family 10 protein [Planktothrix sp. GU0601_MAG3]